MQYNHYNVSRHFILIALFAFLYQHTYAQFGYPLVQVFRQDEYKAHPQNFCAIQDKRGILYIGNNDGLLEFDGINWNLIKTSNSSGVRCLDIDEYGRIYAGATGDIGYISCTENGSIRYISITQLIEKKYRDFNVVWKVICHETGVYFFLSDKILHYFNDKISVIECELGPQYAFKSDNNIYVFTSDGLAILKNEKLIPLKEWTSDPGICIGISEGQGKFTIISEYNGISHFKVDPSGKISNPLQDNISNTELMDFLSQGLPYCAVYTEDKTLIIGSLLNGILAFNHKNKKAFSLNKKQGLPDNTIIGLYKDSFGNLWALMNEGIAVIYLNKPLSLINERHGIEGAALSTTFIDNTQFIGTYMGLFKSADSGDDLVFTQVTDPGTCWALYKGLDFILASHEFNLLILKNNSITSIPQNKTTYCFGTSPLFPDYIFLGQDGLSAIKIENSKICDTVLFPQMPEEAFRKIESDHKGGLWITSEFNGLYHLTFPDTNIRNPLISHIDSTNGLLTMQNNYIQIVHSRIFVVSPKGILELDEHYKKSTDKIRFKVPSDFNNIFFGKQFGVSQLLEINDSVLLANTSIGIGKLISHNGYYSFRNIIPTQLIPDAVRMFYENGILWIASGKGMYSYNIGSFSNNGSFSTIIRMVTIGNDSLLHEGSFSANSIDNQGLIPSIEQSDSLIPTLSYSLNHITFDFHAFYYEKAQDNLYSYYLEGYESEWSKWSTETKKEYTLPEGSYTFHVRCKNIYGDISHEAKFSFNISAPWYRTIIAFICYGIVGILLLIITARLNSKRLRKANIRLENIIKDRTAVITEQKKNITDSIEYARRIQQSVMPQEGMLSQILSDHFVLNMPKDIISGDFFWLQSCKDSVYFAVADCTGHGVPGAFMSMLGVSSLNQLHVQIQGSATGDYLDSLREMIIKSLNQKGNSGENADGMDISICKYSMKTKQLEFSGANNSAYFIHDGELNVIKADKMPIGIYMNDDRKFKTNQISIKPGDCIYLLSDGYEDQFGGADNKKFMSKRLKALLLDIHKKPMSEQKEILHHEFLLWINPYGEKKQAYEQLDDVMIMGIRF